MSVLEPEFLLLIAMFLLPIATIVGTIGFATAARRVGFRTRSWPSPRSTCFAVL
jgi:hypothetical protein